MMAIMQVHVLLCVRNGINYPYAVAKYLSESSGNYHADSSVASSMRRMKKNGLLTAEKQGKLTVYSLTKEGYLILDGFLSRLSEINDAS